MDSTALALTLALFGVLLIAISYQRHRHGRNGSATLHGTAGIALFVSAALLFELALNLRTYQDLQQDTPLAEISFVKSGKRFQASLMRIPRGDLQVFTLDGTSWRIQARLLHWQRQLPLLGLTHELRLEQLQSGDARKPAVVESRYALSHDAGFNLWRWAGTQIPQRAWLRTEVIESTPQAMEDGRRFHVYLHGNELLVSQINRAAKDATRQPPPTPVLNQKDISLLQNSDLDLSRQSTSSRSDSSSSLPGSRP